MSEAHLAASASSHARPHTAAAAAAAAGAPGETPTLLAKPPKTSPAITPSSPSARPAADGTSLTSGLAALKLAGHSPHSPTAASQPSGRTSPCRPTSPHTLDDTLCDALRSSRDRVFLLRQEQDMVEFISNHAASEHVLPLMNSYQRLLVHRCADYYNLHRDVEADTKVVKLSRSADTRIPPLRIWQLFDRLSTAPRPGDVSPFALTASHQSRQHIPGPLRSGDCSPAIVDSNVSPPPGNVPGPSSFRIMRRDPSLTSGNNCTGSSALANDGAPEAGKKSRKDMTIEEREAAYREARERIFGAAFSNGNAEVNPLSNSSDAVAKDRSSISSNQNTDTLEKPAAQTLPPEPSEKRNPSSNEVTRGLGSASNPYAVTTSHQFPLYPTQFDPGCRDLSAVAPAFDPSSYPTMPTSIDRGAAWAPVAAQQQQSTSHQPIYWPPYQQPAQSPLQIYQHQPSTAPQALYQYLYPQSSWQSLQQPGFYYAQHTSNNGSTSNVSSVDAFSPFPPTPSTNSSVGIPSPAPSISGSSNSAVSNRARGSRGAGDGDQLRRGSRTSNSNESLGIQRGGTVTGAQSVLPQPPPRNPQQQQYGELSVPSTSTSRSASPVSIRGQPVEGRRVVPAGNGASGRLNVGDRTLFDPSRSGSGNEGSAQLKSLKALRGAEEVPGGSLLGSLAQQTTQLYLTQQPMSGGGYMPVTWPSSATLYAPSQQPGGYQQPPSSMDYYGLPPSTSVMESHMRFANGMASPPAVPVGLQGRATHTVGASSIRLGSVTPAQAAPTSPGGVAIDAEVLSQRQQQQPSTLPASMVAPIPGLPARPDWVLASLNSNQDVRSAALASLPSAPSHTSIGRTSAEVSGATSALEVGSLATTPRSSCRSLNEYGMGGEKIDSKEKEQQQQQGERESGRRGKVGEGEGDENDDDDDDESAESSSLGPSASASNVGGDDESEGPGGAAEEEGEDVAGVIEERGRARRGEDGDAEDRMGSGAS